MSAVEFPRHPREVRLERVAKALAQTAAGELGRQSPLTVNFHMLQQLFEINPYRNVTARQAWEKFKQIDQLFAEDGKLPLIAAAAEPLYEIPRIPDDYAMTERVRMRLQIEDMKIYDKELLMVENLPQLAELQSSSRRYGSIKVVKQVAADIVDIYSALPETPSDPPSAGRLKRLAGKVLSWKT